MPPPKKLRSDVDGDRCPKTIESRCHATDHQALITKQVQCTLHPAVVSKLVDCDTEERFEAALQLGFVEAEASSQCRGARNGIEFVCEDVARLLKPLQVRLCVLLAHEIAEPVGSRDYQADQLEGFCFSVDELQPPVEGRSAQSLSRRQDFGINGQILKACIAAE